MQSTILSDPSALLRARELFGERDPDTGRRTGAIIPVPLTTAYRWMDEGSFPRPVRLGANCVAWRASDISSWLESREQA